MVDGKRVHRKLPEGAIAGNAKLAEAEFCAAVVWAPKKVKIPGAPPMTTILAIYTHACEAPRPPSTILGGSAHGPNVTRPAKHRNFHQVIRDISKLIENQKTKIGTGLCASDDQSLACAKKGLTLAWLQRLIPENYGLRTQNVQVNNKHEVFLTVEQMKKIESHCTPITQAAIWAALLTGARRDELFRIERSHIGRDTITFPASNAKTRACE